MGRAVNRRDDRSNGTYLIFFSETALLSSKFFRTSWNNLLDVVNLNLESLLSFHAINMLFFTYFDSSELKISFKPSQGIFFFCCERIVKLLCQFWTVCDGVIMFLLIILWVELEWLLNWSCVIVNIFSYSWDLSLYD